MSITAKVLIPAKQAENAQTTQYTAVNCKASIVSFTATNTGAANAWISVHIVASGGSASASNQIIDERNLARLETYTCPELIGQILESGMFLSTNTSAASTITIRASGYEIT